MMMMTSGRKHSALQQTQLSSEGNAVGVLKIANIQDIQRRYASSRNEEEKSHIVAALTSSMSEQTPIPTL